MKLVVGGLSLVIGLTICEVIIRAVIGAPLTQRLPLVEIRANPYRGWEMVPSQMHYTHHHQVYVNSLGFRGPEVERKGPGEIRVLALGDSMTYGQGVADHETLPHYLESLLRTRDPQRRSWTVINAGHRAYDTSQELALLEQFRELLQPDVVLLLWYVNDLQKVDIATAYAIYRAKGRVTLDTKDRIEGWERIKWEAVQLLRRSALIMYVHDILRDIGTKPMEVDVIEKGLARLGQHLDRFLETAAIWRFRPVFAVIPDANTLVGSPESEAVETHALQLALARGIPTVRPIEPLIALYRRTGRLPLVPFDGHYSAGANRGMAEVIADVILREAPIP